MSIDTRQAARDIIASHADDIEYGSIGDWFYNDAAFKALTEAEQDAVVTEVDELIRPAAVTVTLPGDQVCTGCGGTGQPGESDGTPKDLPQWEDLRALLEEQRDSDATDNELADKVMALFGGEPGC
jgi:hypothetical protein